MSKEVKTWKAKVRYAFEEREKLYSDTDISNFEKYFHNAQTTNDKVLSVNLIAPMIRRLIAQVYFRNPHLVIKSLDRSGEEKAPIIARLWNTKIDQLGLKKQIRMEIQDTHSVGWGVMKLGYETEFAVDPAAKFLSENEFQFSDQDTPAEQNVIAPGSPYWLRVHPADVALQVGRRDVDSATWAVHRYYRDLTSLKKDKRFKNTSGLVPDYAVNSARSGSQAAYSDSLADQQARAKEDLVLMYEIRDLISGDIMVCAANQSDKWLYKEVDEITRLIERLPFYFLIFNPLTQNPYGASSIDLARRLQKEFNDIRTQDMHQRRVSILKVLVKKGLLSPDEMEKMVSEEVGPVIEINGQVDDSNIKVFQPHQGIDMQVASEAVRRDLREVLGLGRNQMGEQMSGRHTALESANVQRAFDIMVNDNRTTVSEHVIELVQGAHRLISGRPGVEGFWTDKRFIDLANEMGIRKDVPFKGTDLVGSYSFRVDVESSPPITTQQMQAERIGIYSALAQNPRINQNYLLKWTASVFEDLDGEQLIVTEDRYIQAQKQTLEAGQQLEDANRQKDEAAEANKRQDDRDTKIVTTAIQAASKPEPASKSSEKK